VAGKKFYILDDEKKEIIIDKSVVPTDLDLKMVAMYGSMGYKPHEKIIRKAKKGSTAALKDADIVKALASNREALAKYNEIKNGKGKGFGFFAAKAYAAPIIQEAKKAKK